MTEGVAIGIPEWGPFLVEQAAPGIHSILERLCAANTALQLQCADASVGHFIPAMRQLPGFEQLHRENYAVSYHLATAIGSAMRIIQGSRHPGFLALIVSCQKEAAAHQSRAMEAYRRMAPSAAPAVRGLIMRLGGMLETTAGHIAGARGLTQALLGPDLVQRLARAVEATSYRGD